MTPLGAERLPDAIRSRIVASVNGLDMHALEAGSPDHPCVLLLHGFPELAYSWRRIMPALAHAGFYAVAPDQRGYGRTTGWDDRYDGDVAASRMTNLAADAVALLAALGRADVALVAGHDFGSNVAAVCALARPDVFVRVALMSAPWPGAPAFPFTPKPDLDPGLAALDPPRKHYHRYYTTRPANADMHGCAQGVHDFLRAYFHMKSADWSGNAPHTLAGWTAEALGELPPYYVMPRDRTMAETVAPHMPAPDAIAACRWLTDAELRIYSDDYARTGFQGGLNWYRCRSEALHATDLRLFAGRTIDVPTIFIGGDKDWGVRQTPGALEATRDHACTRFQGLHLVPGAGHWVQQEQPEAVLAAMLTLLRSPA